MPKHTFAELAASESESDKSDSDGTGAHASTLASTEPSVEPNNPRERCRQAPAKAKTQCPDCWSPMEWYTNKEPRSCSNSAANGGQCVTPSTSAWWCPSCRKTFCVGCLSSLLAIRKGQSWHDIEDEQEEDEAVIEDWEVVPAKEKRRPKEQAPPAAGSRQVGKVAGLIEDFCQRRELDNWVRLELQKIPAPEVGRVLHRLSCRMQDDPHVNLRALIAVERANSAQGHRRLDPSQCTQLQEWIQTLQLADVQRNEMFGVLSDGFTWAEFLHLRNQANFAKKCREGAWEKPVRAACGIMTSYRVDQYRHQVASFAIKFRLGQTAEKQLTDIGPKLGAQFMESWCGDRNARKQNKVGQDMERLNREIKELYLKELQMRDRSKWNARSMAGNQQGKQGEDIFKGWDDGENIDHIVREGPGAGTNNNDYEDDDDDDDEEDHAMETSLDEEEDDWVPPLPNMPALAKPKIGSAVIDDVTTSVSQGDSLLRSEADRKRVAVESHFIMVVDTSGSMSEMDCQQVAGGTDQKCTITRIQAVFNEVKQLASTENARSGVNDKMSLITFSDAAEIKFQETSLESAQKHLAKMGVPKPWGQTYYAKGLLAAAQCARADQKKRPIDVIFLSDGEPTDPEDMLSTLQELTSTRANPKELTVHCIGFGAGAAAAAVGAMRYAKGEDGDAFAYLSQLAAVGNGHFHKASNTVASLRGAFRAVTSSISTSRTTSRTSQRKAEEEEAAKGQQGSEDANGPKWVPKKKESVEKEVQFELRNVIFDLDGGSLGTREVKAIRRKYEFDGSHFFTKKEETTVFIRRNPFTRGGMRHCYGFRDPGLESGHKRMRMVAKKQKWVTEPDVDPLTSVDIYAKQTAVAHYYARGFQKEVERQTGKLINLDFVPCYAYRPIAAEDEDLEGFCGEQFVSGEFVKLTSNAGFVNREEYGGHAVFGSAFSHYTFHYSSGALLVADIQGVCSGHRDDGRKGRKAPNREDENRSWVLSDPQVLTDGVSYQFGRGDLGLKGMSMFFKSHKCSWLCKMLGLKDITNIKRPTAQLYFPGSTNLLAGLHGRQGSFVKEAKLQSGATRITLPREAYDEWLVSTIFTINKDQALKARELMYARLEMLLEQYSLQTLVPKDSPAYHWTPTYWKTKRLEWMQKSGGAQIVLHHGGPLSEKQPEDEPVELIYIFPKETEKGRGQERPDMRHRNYAKALIDHEVLDKPLPDRMQDAEPAKYTAPLLQRMLDFVKRSGGEVPIPTVLRMFGKELAPESNQNNTQRIRFLAWVLEFRHNLAVDNSKDIVQLVKPKSTARPVSTPVPAVAKQEQWNFDWLHNTQWKEKDFHAVYTIAKQKPGKKGQFVVTKSCVGQQTYDICVHIDENGLLHYGDKKKWCLTSCDERELVWTDFQAGNRPYIWNRFSVEPKGAGKGKQVAPKGAWPDVGAPIGAPIGAPLVPGKQATGGKDSAKAGKEAAATKADPRTNGDPWQQAREQATAPSPAGAKLPSDAGAKPPKPTEGPPPPPPAQSTPKGEDPWDQSDPWTQVGSKKNAQKQPQAPAPAPTSAGSAARNKASSTMPPAEAPAPAPTSAGSAARNKASSTMPPAEAPAPAPTSAGSAAKNKASSTTPAEAPVASSSRSAPKNDAASQAAAPAVAARKESRWAHAGQNSRPAQQPATAAPSEPPQVPTETPKPRAPDVWSKYDHEGRLWFSHPSGRWFWANDAEWDQYQVPPDHPAAGRVYRWNNRTEECFWEDTGMPM